MTRLRIRYAKVGKIRWTSHRDVARMWERAFRQTRFPVAYSSGFSPRPRISFGLALPTGHESVAEYLDVDVADGEAPALAGLTESLSTGLPAGVDAVAVASISPGTPSLQEDVTSCTWRWSVGGAEGSPPRAWLEEQVAALRDASTAVISRQRKGNEVAEDIRPAILDLRITDEGWLVADLATQPRSIRPADVLRGLGPDLEERAVRRLHQWILRDDARQEPLAAPPGSAAAGPIGQTDAPHARARANQRRDRNNHVRWRFGAIRATAI
jgi:radical SAM-linked protein